MSHKEDRLVGRDPAWSRCSPADLDHRYAPCARHRRMGSSGRGRGHSRASLKPHGQESWDGPTGECGLAVQEPPRTPNIDTAAGVNSRFGCTLGMESRGR